MRLVKYLGALAFAAAPVIAAVPAGALPVINTYQVVSRFGGTVGTITQQYTLAFDPSVSSSGTVQNYSTSTGNPSFNPAGGVLFSSSPSSNVYQGMVYGGSNVAVGGAINGINFPTAGTFDFRTLFFVTPTTGAVTGGGMLIPFNADTDYSDGGSTVPSTFDVTVTLIASSVPEASTWAMMIAGFGVIGGGLRARRRASPALAAA